tara:strand:- start:106 stop:333 length:228 start_codon:yes stop_codon:yes gene_type:complete
MLRLFSKENEVIDQPDIAVGDGEIFIHEKGVAKVVSILELGPDHPVVRDSLSFKLGMLYAEAVASILQERRAAAN